MASVDGLSDAEITKILFKNYMNFASTGRDFEFFEETNITNTTNIFATNVMKDTPLTEPTFQAASSDQIKSSFKDFAITDDWISEYTQEAGAGFKVDPSDSSIIRFENIKLDYTGKNSDAFYCEDACGVNILNHLLPFNYGNEAATLNGSFAITLKYKKQTGSEELVDITWLATHGACQTTVDADSGAEPIAWGAPLFDTKNGVITFYDTTSDLGGSAVFDTASPPEFFFSATKYVGDFGVGSDSSNSESSGNFWEQDASLNILHTSGNVSISGDLDISRGVINTNNLIANVVKIGYADSVGVSGEGVSGEGVSGEGVSGEGVSGETYTTVSGPVLDVSGDVSFNGRVDISGTLYVNGVEISGNVSGGSNSTSGDLTVGGDLDVSGMINMDGDKVATQEWVNNQSFASGASGGGGAVAGVAITDDTTLTAINVATDLSENHNEYKTVHRSNQPPSLESVSSPITESPSEFKIEWNYFDAHFIDSYDGRVYPLSLQTFVDVSYTIDGSSSDGYFNVYVGQGTYDFSGIKVNGCEDLTIPNSGFPFRNDTGDRRLHFEGQLDEGDIPPFMAGSVFDFKVYAINQSQTIQPRYIEIKGAQLSSTGPPGKVSIVDFDDFEQNSFTMDFSFNLDASNTDTTSGIKIKNYDISYALTDSRSFVTPTDSDINDVKSIPGDDLSKDDVVLDNLYPGAIYDVEVRAKNETSTDIGEFGDVSNSVIYTNTGTNQYITYNDLVDVNPKGITMSLVGVPSIECCIAADTTVTPSHRYIANSNSIVSLSNTSSDFYINYGMQGKSMKDNIDANLVQFIARKGTKLLGGTEDYDYDSPIYIDLVAKNPGDTNNIVKGSIGNYNFTSSVYEDAYATTNPKNQGFVYKVSIDASQNDSTIAFTTTYPPGTTEYIYKYNIACDSVYNNTTLDGTNDSVEVSTEPFFVDNYGATPSIQYTTAPYMVESGYSVLFGVPSVTKITLIANIQISNFASFLIPHQSGVHSFTDAINDSTVYQSVFPSHEEKDKTVDSYGYTYNHEVNIKPGVYKSNITHTFNTTVYYLGGQNTAPQVKTHSVPMDCSYSSELFRDPSTGDAMTYLYSVTIYTFGVGGAETFNRDFAVTNFQNFSSLGGTSLLYFNGKWVSGGYKVTYNNVEIFAFRDWSTGSSHGTNLGAYNNGPKNTHYGYYKWIVFNVTNKKTPNGTRLDLSNLKLNGSSVTTNDHSVTYRAYIATVANNSIVYGSFKSVTQQAPLWPKASYTTLAAADAGSGAWTSTNDLSTMLADANDNSKDYYLVVGLPVGSPDYIEFS